MAPLGAKLALDVVGGYDGAPAAVQCEGCTKDNAQVRELSFLHSRDVTFAVFPGTAGGQTQARAALASLTLAYDTGTGALTAAGANGSVSVADSLATAPVQ